MRYSAILAGVVLSISATTHAQQQPSAAATGDDKKSITVTGCLQAGAQPNQFVLAATSAAADPLAKGVAVATAGTVPNIHYILSGGSNLSAHVGHRVEITGASSGKSQKAAATESSTTRTDVPNKPDPKVEVKEKTEVEVRDLQIESLKMVAASCAAAK
jgi:hypothetical protein